MNQFEKIGTYCNKCSSVVCVCTKRAVDERFIKLQESIYRAIDSEIPLVTTTNTNFEFNLYRILSARKQIASVWMNNPEERETLEQLFINYNIHLSNLLGIYIP